MSGINPTFTILLIFDVSNSVPAVLHWRAIYLRDTSLTSCPSPCYSRSCPRHRSGLRAVLCRHHTPHSPARRSPAPAQTCPATRSRHLRCLQPALALLRLPLKSPSTGIPAGPQTRRAVQKGKALCSVNASYPTTPPSGMWRKFMSSFDHCQVRDVERNTRQNTSFRFLLA